MCCIEEGEKSTQSEDKTEEEADGDRDVRHGGEISVGGNLERTIDEVGVVMADKGCRERESNYNRAP